MKERKIIRFIATVAIFASLSAVLYFLKFPLPFLFPAFLELQFSTLPAIICGFTLGPLGGTLVLVVKTLIMLPFSKTVYVGDFADLIIGLSVVLSSSFIYKKYHTKKGGVIALACSSIVWVLVAILANYLVLVPFYIELFYKGSIEGFISDCRVVITNINEDNYMLYYLLLAVVPFNLLVSFIVNTVTYLVYKKVSTIIHYKE